MLVDTSPTTDDNEHMAESSLGEMSIPESRTYSSGEKYRFLVHTALHDPAEAFDFIASGKGERLDTSLIDQDHTQTFEGWGGFIVEPPVDEADVLATYATDVGVNQPHTSDATIKGDQLLAETDPKGYNQVVIKPKGVVGVFIRIAADDGRELGSVAQNDHLKALAAEHGLPVALIAVEPNPIAEADPVISELSGFDGKSKLWQLVAPHNGFEYRVDVAEVPENAPMDYQMGESLVLRVMRVNEYGEHTRPLDDKDNRAPAELKALLADLQKLDQDHPAIKFATHKLSEGLTAIEATE